MNEEYAIEALSEEVAQLKTKIALGFMEATEEDKRLAESLFNEQRDEISILTIELTSVRKSRDDFQAENAKLKRKIAVLEKKIKG